MYNFNGKSVSQTCGVEELGSIVVCALLDSALVDAVKPVSAAVSVGDVQRRDRFEIVHGVDLEGEEGPEKGDESQRCQLHFGVV